MMANVVQTKEEYTKSMYAILSRLAVQEGFNVAVVPGMIAQSYQEGWNSGLATKYFNYWGMKAGSSYKGRTVAMNNKAGNDPAIYRVFTSMEDGCRGYFTFLNYSRYRSLKDCTSSEEYLLRIGPCGWNSNSGYGQRCVAHLPEVRKYLTISYPLPTRTLKNGVRGDDVKWLQSTLNKIMDAELKIDGIFGEKTEQAVRDFQTKVFVDGIVGKDTLGKLKG
jgi:hypothetical protein